MGNRIHKDQHSGEWYFTSANNGYGYTPAPSPTKDPIAHAAAMGSLGFMAVMIVILIIVALILHCRRLLIRQYTWIGTETAPMAEGPPPMGSFWTCCLGPTPKPIPDFGYHGNDLTRSSSRGYVSYAGSHVPTSLLSLTTTTLSEPDHKVDLIEV
ncbi:protein ORF27 [Anguillid herpesvirus 1]|uniref:Protein ORF27 n=1 Tax=Anguillid herpesvirus 1 TaxID=150286 RepID=A0A8E5ETN7_9VIRU|nr:protein ORF27 [Anguillid herpesvirus 1]QRM16713.1 protein ORF27 [Anguillid herpesvirus 1]QRM16844.1 protein ORF27 [Anguillid herpesvirus 1]QRM17105.1 protein ORF27 [Anguillid herpesvirus 1]UWI83601.1 protein ORF27 [Anguillid herpesvirus 1]